MSAVVLVELLHERRAVATAVGRLGDQGRLLLLLLCCLHLLLVQLLLGLLLLSFGLLHSTALLALLLDLMVQLFQGLGVSLSVLVGPLLEFFLLLLDELAPGLPGVVADVAGVFVLALDQVAEVVEQRALPRAIGVPTPDFEFSVYFPILAAQAGGLRAEQLHVCLFAQILLAKRTRSALLTSLSGDVSPGPDFDRVALFVEPRVEAVGAEQVEAARELGAEGQRVADDAVEEVGGVLEQQGLGVDLGGLLADAVLLQLALLQQLVQVGWRLRGMLVVRGGAAATGIINRATSNSFDGQHYGVSMAVTMRVDLGYRVDELREFLKPKLTSL
mmetsp:Transcript_35829/g.89234  ORF Transcript_35829/g.89234 Transcript_35829/m.89234 type:complete len:331 (+) Transcript_35829:497-1489(+)